MCRSLVWCVCVCWLCVCWLLLCVDFCCVLAVCVCSQNKSAFLCGVMKTYRQREKQGSKIQESTKGPDEAKIKVRDHIWIRSDYCKLFPKHENQFSRTSWYNKFDVHVDYKHINTDQFLSHGWLYWEFFLMTELPSLFHRLSWRGRDTPLTSLQDRGSMGGLLPRRCFLECSLESEQRWSLVLMFPRSL